MVSDLVDSLVVLVGQLDRLEVGLDTGRVRALGQHDVAATQTPCDEDLSQRVAVLLGDLVQRRVLADLLARRGHLVLRAQGRVGLGQDIILEAEVNQLVVGQEGVDLDLVDVWLDLGELEQLLEALDGPVGDTNGARLLFLVELLHRAPCLLGVLSQIFEDDVLSKQSVYIFFSLRFLLAHGSNALATNLSIGTNLGLLLAILLGRNGPVNQEEIDIVELELLQGVVERPQDVVVAVQVVPDFGADEDVLPLDGGVLLEEVLQGLANLILVLVEPCAVQVSVTRLQRNGDGVVRLALGTLVAKGTEADSGDLNTVGEGEGDAGGHLDDEICNELYYILRWRGKTPGYVVVKLEEREILY